MQHVLKNAKTSTHAALPSVFQAGVTTGTAAEKNAFVAREEHHSDKVIPLPVLTSPDAPLLFTQQPERKNLPKELPVTDAVFESSMPIEDFGKAMLLGMGYKETENEVKPVLFDGRPMLLGLGATPKLSEPGSKKPARVYMTKGSLVRILPTQRFGVVIQTDGVPGLDMIRLVTFPPPNASRVDTNELVTMDVPKKNCELIPNLTELGSDHPGKQVYRVYEKQEQLGNSSSTTTDNNRDGVKRVKLESKSWLHPNIRVMMIKDDEYYKKKGVIVRVLGAGERCDVRLEKHPFPILENVKAKYLQTIVPSEPGARLVVVRGVHAGRLGNLVERGRREDGRRFVRLVIDDGEEIECDEDDCAQFIDV